MCGDWSEQCLYIVSNGFLFLVVRHLLLVAMHLLLVTMHLLLVAMHLSSLLSRKRGTHRLLIWHEVISHIMPVMVFSFDDI